MALDTDAGGAHQKRPVGAGLGIGILLLPLVFALFTLRKGHSTLARIVAFGWLILIMISAVALGSSSNNLNTTLGEDAEATALATDQDETNVEGAIDYSAAEAPEDEANTEAFLKFKKMYLNLMDCHSDVSSYIAAYNNLPENFRIITIEDAEKIRAWHENEIKFSSGYAGGRGFSMDEISAEVTDLLDSKNVSSNDPDIARKTIERINKIIENITSEKCAMTST